jgi:hypothetical protein
MPGLASAESSTDVLDSSAIHPCIAVFLDALRLSQRFSMNDFTKGTVSLR